MPYGTPDHDPASARSRRHIFGDDAEQYDTARPGYPPQLVQDVLDFSALAAHEPALEVGAGTGKATLAFARSGVPVTCVEPDVRMARVLRRRCAELPEVTVEVADFESWRPGRRYGLLYCAQAWHWVDPAARWDRARAALSPGGAIGLFWNHWCLSSGELTERLTAAHARHGIEIPADTLLDPRPRPARRGPESRQWREMTAAGFVAPEHRLYTSVHERSTSALLGLLASYGGYRALPARPREQVLDEGARIVDAHGGHAQVRVTTSLFLGRTAR
ncbi:class I SAM-dependent methyltransferase [Streptomyces sp. A1-5]|uniref:class I SAM-dependent methyltransferase n=1 Tax=Streptomyces sp. A1-5 TaxID=2738410 RepID=UPI001F4738C0|nr:methyltransferase domain-containing protein [Streptomyces sp. A1-5]UJB44951.1 class I SAM-dependent methyltransferase [Streptomyces sp. A1-5]